MKKIECYVEKKVKIYDIKLGVLCNLFNMSDGEEIFNIEIIDKRVVISTIKNMEE